MRPRCLLVPLLLAGACSDLPVPPPPVDIPVDLPRFGPKEPVTIASDWAEAPDRTWVGPRYWANRLQDWHIADGRLECIGNRLPWRTLHLLEARLPDQGAQVELRVRLGLTGTPEAGGARAGFLLGAGAEDLDHRAAALVQSAPGPEGGILAGVDQDGALFLRDFWAAGGGPVLPDHRSDARLSALDAVELRLVLREVEGQLNRVELLLEAYAPGQLPEDAATALPEGIAPLARVEALYLDEGPFTGNLALFAHQPAPNDAADPPRFWFDGWRMHGYRLLATAGHRFGPVLGAQHTLSEGALKLTAQFPPLSAQALATPARLQLLRGGAWEDVATAPIVAPGWTATFHLTQWDSARSEQYRVLYPWQGEDHSWAGTIRADPKGEAEIALAALSCNHNNRHGFGREGYPFSHDTLWFPHAELTAHIARADPDLLFFAGDQIYEGASPTFPDREQPYLDYAYKWFLWHWAFADLARDRPCITIPDDHDVYQGNLWGAGGVHAARDNQGGYVMPAEWVQMVERTQTSHLPDPWSDEPLAQGITSYYTDLLYGGVSFAILEDRKFKSGPAGLVEHDGPRPDHITDPDIDPADVDVEGAVLLGEEQLRFLEHWADEDWAGAEMKATLSATVFAALATHHGGNQDYLRMDLDSNGWPQSGRDEALRRIRRAFGVMIGGDQHLSTLAHHGIDAWDDAGFSFVVPAIANFYARSWRPPGEPKVPLDETDPLPHTGSYFDGFGNRVTVYAHTNPAPSGQEPAALHDQMPGWGMIRFRKPQRSIVFECWPRWADPAVDPQYPGWPFEVPQLLNGGRRFDAELPLLRVSGMRDPVVQVIDDFTGEVVYTLRIRGQTFRPPVPEEGLYNLRVGELGTDREAYVASVRATEGNTKELIVDV